MATEIALKQTGFAIISSAIGEQDVNNHTASAMETAGSHDRERFLLVQFAKITGNDRYREDLGTELTITAQNNEQYSSSIFVGILRKPFSPERETYSSYGYPANYASVQLTIPGEKTAAFGTGYADKITENGILISSFQKTTISTKVSGKVFLGEYVRNGIKAVKVNGSTPEKQTLNRTQTSTFSLELKEITLSAETPPITSAKFRYRAKGASTYTEVSTGTALSYDMLGNLMPTGEMEFQWTITDVLGQTDTTEWFTVKTYNGVFRSTSPTGNAFINRYKDALFSCTLEPGIALKYFRYRKQGVTSYTEKAADNATKSYKLPANTITEGANFEYQWYTTDQYGMNWISGWFKFNTIEALSKAEIIEPNSSLVDMDRPIVFRWSHIISTGSAQTKAELQKSTDGSTWTALRTVSGANTSVELPARTLPSGSWYWRVRTYNADGNAGAWSAAAQFIAIASPSTPTITAIDKSTRPTIQWQTSEQQAYEIILDGVPAKYYGTDKKWTSSAYLADGEHTIGVRAQNSYGRWSEVGEIIITIANKAGPQIVLTAEGAELWWKSTGDYDRYEIYRDLKKIAETRETSYTDHLGNGAASYQVRGCYADSNDYGLSNVAEVEIKSEYYTFYDMEGGATLEVKHCGLRNQPVTRNNERDLSFVHIPGYEHPAVERSEFRDEAMNGAAVFFAADEVKQFNRMSGRLVCVKTPDGKAFHGVLNSVETTPVGLRWDCTFKLTCVAAEAKYAKVSTAMFDIDIESGSLIMTTSDSYGGPEFSLNIVGDLEVKL